MFTYRRRSATAWQSDDSRGRPVCERCVNMHALRHVLWQPLKPATRHNHLLGVAAAAASLIALSSPWKLLSAIGQSHDQQVTWRQDGVERRHCSGARCHWNTGNEARKDNSSSVWRRFLSQPVGSAYSRWTDRSSACRQWTRLHQPRTSKQLHHGFLIFSLSRPSTNSPECPISRVAQWLSG